MMLTMRSPLMIWKRGRRLLYSKGGGWELYSCQLVKEGFHASRSMVPVLKKLNSKEPEPEMSCSKSVSSTWLGSKCQEMVKREAVWRAKSEMASGMGWEICFCRQAICLAVVGLEILNSNSRQRGAS